ncbi:MAG: glycoside hydrolase family 3 C-terminal domain-containing protein [Pseudobutyrivibrio sp.]|nr:glycoside hydrolase family 3 C-terminal domain-containing protein [Pseudobutyrivibrio sp.]
MEKWARLKYQPNLPLGDERVTCSSRHIALSKEAATEGIVLLKNNGLFPLKKNAKVALFGKGSFDYVKGGGGSGDVYTRYIKNVYQGLKETEHVVVFEPLSDYYRDYVLDMYSKGAAAGMISEPVLSDDMYKEASKNSDVALIFISRFSGEGWDRSTVVYEGEYNPWESETSMPKLSGEIFPDGDFYLTQSEKTLIEKVTSLYDKVGVILNIGGIIDTSWIRDDDRISACLNIGQGGMEGGSAAAEVICGIKYPSGKLVDTYAASLEDYPSTAGFHQSYDYVDYIEDIFVGYRYFETFNKPRVYPFGYGLSYTSFAIQVNDCAKSNDKIIVDVTVTNTGNAAGKEVVQLYVTAPSLKLSKSKKSLVAFKKTKELLPGEKEKLQLSFNRYMMSSYDDLGIIAKSAYVLEAGEYGLYVGSNISDVFEAGTITVEKDTILQQLVSRCAPTQLEKRLLSDGTYESLPAGQPNDKDDCIFDKMIPGTEEGYAPAVRGRESVFLFSTCKEGKHPLIDVAEDKLSLDDFLNQMETEELIELLGGQPNLGVANTWGMGNMPEYGIPSIMTSDGPAGVRINPCCGVATTAWPCATTLACSWNEALIEQVGTAGAAELKENNLAIWLTPAVNIHRNPLCGRNFEYYSEDPLLTGKLAAAMVRGIQSNNVACSVKHFAANNKETNRKHCDSRVSERALREIYLKQFEIIVKEAKPWTIMTSYNVINGHRASECKELLDGILRDEWGFDGMVTTDWWTRGEHYKEILAGNDVKMACGYPKRVKKALDMGAITRNDIQKCAKRVLELILKFD